jgi:hypothetical protein
MTLSVATRSFHYASATERMMERIQHFVVRLVDFVDLTVVDKGAGQLCGFWKQVPVSTGTPKGKLHPTTLWTISHTSLSTVRTCREDACCLTADSS